MARSRTERHPDLTEAAYQVSCSACGAPSGDTCIDRRFSVDRRYDTTLIHPHAARRWEARAQGFRRLTI